MPNILKWRETSYPAIHKAKKQEHRSEAEEDLCEVAAVSTQYKQQDPVTRLQCRRHNLSLLNSNMHLPSVLGTPTNAKGVKGMDTGQINAHRTDKGIEEEEVTTVEEDLDVDDVVDRKCSVDVEEETNQSMPPWSRPDQELLHRRHRCRKLPQCPCLQGRETNCAPSWPVQSAGGEVGAP